ncbi:MAG TPA: hypothetical protein VLX29_04680 [Nitrospirota bacterium]|nr:hypothetical protein [Nitrospirota bacterium]
MLINTSGNTKNTNGNERWHKSLVRVLYLVFVMAVLFPSSAFPKSANKLVDDDEYKDKDFHRGIITDYSDMVKGDEVNWEWVKPEEKISDYTVKISSMDNKSDMRSKEFSDSVKSIFADYFADTKGAKGTLRADLCITEVQPFSPGKAWIPFIGGHQMQAAVGMEVVFHDQNGNVVAKFRDFEREGTDPKQAAEKVAAQTAKEIHKHY